MDIIFKIKSKFTYCELEALYATEDLKKKYDGMSICGGSLRGKRIVVTGGSSGIGLSIARRLLKEGAHVMIIARNLKKLQTAIKELNNPNVSYLCWDCSDYANIRSTLDKITEIWNHERIDGWINCHGILSDWDRMAAFRRVPYKDFRKELDINFCSVQAIIETVADYMSQNGIKGTILSISSIYGIFKNVVYTPYGISKIGVIGAVRRLAEKYSKLGITIVGIAPGSVATNIGANIEGSSISTNRTLLKRYALPEEIAALAVALVSPMGKYLNGEVIIASAAENYYQGG